MKTIEFNPYAHEVHDNPYEYYKVMREQEPVYYNEEHKFWILTKWEDCHNAFRDFKTFSSVHGPGLEPDINQGQGSLYPMFIASDPPLHTRQRKIVSRFMTPQAVVALEPYVRQKAINLLTPHLPSGKIDMVEDFSALLPMDVISTMIHVPESDQDTVRGWADDLIARADGQAGVTDRQAHGYLNLGGYFDKLAKERAPLPADSNDLFSALLEAEKAGDLPHADLIGFGILLAVAGNETTTKLIGNMCYRLWEHQQQRQMLIDDPSLMAMAVEEVLRFDGSSQIIGRTCTKDTVIRGKTIKAGDRVGLAIISASRDEEKFPNAETFDITRGERGHMAFGFGIHACLGSALARLEVRICMEEILRLMPDYEIDSSRLTRIYNPNVRGYNSMPMTFTPSS